MSSRTSLLNQFETMVNEASPEEVITGFAAVEHSRPGTRFMIRVHTAQKVQIHTVTSGWLNITVQRAYAVWVDDEGHMDHGLSEKPTVVVA